MNILICGFGSIGKQYYEALSNYQDYKVSVLTNQKLELERVFNYSDSIDKNFFDLIIISNETINHLETFKYLKNNSELFLIEKPLSMSVNSTEKYLSELKSKKVYVSAPLRYKNGYEFLLNFVKSEGNKISKVEVKCLSWLPNWRPERDFQKGYWAQKNQGGVLRDLVHEFDYILSVFGFPLRIYGSTESNSLIGNLDVETRANAVLTYANFDVNVELDYFSHLNERSATIYLEDKSYFVWDLIKDDVVWHINEKEVRKELYSPFNKQSLLLRQVTSIVEKNRFPTDLIESINNLSIVDSVRECNEEIHYTFDEMDQFGIWRYKKNV
jgi:predicted dehydrogenase